MWVYMLHRLKQYQAREKHIKFSNLLHSPDYYSYNIQTAMLMKASFGGYRASV